jgi:hypothetical protein
MKNTKGKWEIENRSDKITQVISYDINTAEAKDICVVSDDWNEQVANANLIATAPDLLRAIKPLVKRIKAEDSWAKDYNQIKFAEEAIAKAEGK